MEAGWWLSPLSSAFLALASFWCGYLIGKRKGRLDASLDQLITLAHLKEIEEDHKNETR